MNVIRCTKCNLHYDVDKYSTCPHCNETVDSLTSKVSDTDVTKKSKRVFFGKKEKSDEGNIHTLPDDSGEKTFSAFSFGNFKNISDSSDNHEEIYDKSNENNISTEATNTSTDKSGEESYEEVFEETPEEEEDFEDPNSSSKSSLTKEIENITKNNTGRTLGYFSMGDSEVTTNSASNNTSRVEQKNVQGPPVVGWLVCTKGNHLGESFQLSEGNNSIGRGNSNDVILFKEPSVSSNKHAIIIYEPEKRYFLIQSGDSHGLTYLNDDLVTIPQKINIYDSIRFGKSSFIFIPLCGEKFSWEEYIGR